jgi:hypothetical protein
MPEKAACAGTLSGEIEKTIAESERLPPLNFSVEVRLLNMVGTGASEV